MQWKPKKEWSYWSFTALSKPPPCLRCQYKFVVFLWSFRGFTKSWEANIAKAILKGPEAKIAN